MRLKDFFHRINSTNSTKEKEQILQEFKDQKEILQILNYALDPYKNFYIKKLPEYIQLRPLSKEVSYKHFINLLDRLSSRTVTGNAARDEVISFFENCDTEDAPIYKKVLLKDAIGIGAATVNKVLPKHIPEFKVMLAPSQLPNLTDLNYPLYVQPKYDGFRAIYKEGKFYTRSGLIYPNTNLENYFKDLIGINNYVLDGELYIHNKPFEEMSKVLNADSAVIPDNLKFYVYDCLPIKDWQNQSTKLSYVDRLKLVRSIVNDTVANYSKVIDSPTDLVESPSEVVEIYKKYLKNGYEGCMLKSQEGKYQWKRTTLKSGEMIKLKPFETLDLKVTGIFDGEGKYEGKAGGIIVDYNSTPVSVGSGFDDITREEISKQPDNYIGKIAEIKYFEETDEGSLRFPIFIRWRDDK